MRLKPSANKNLKNDRLIHSMNAYRVAQEKAQELDRLLDVSGWMMDLSGSRLMEELGVKHLVDSDEQTKSGRFISDIISDVIWEVDYASYEALEDKINLKLLEIEAGLL